MAFILRSRLKLTNWTSGIRKAVTRPGTHQKNHHYLIPLPGSMRNMASDTAKSEEAKAVEAVYKPGEETVFDKIIQKKIPVDLIFEDEHCLAFNDITPQAPVHFLVITKKRIPMLNDATEEDGELLAHVLLKAKKLAQEKLPNGYRLVINNGKDGCQSVYHLHIHVLGGRKMHWPPG